MGNWESTYGGVIYEKNAYSLYDHAYYMGIRWKGKLLTGNPLGQIFAQGEAPLSVLMRTNEQDIFDPLRFISHRLQLMSTNTYDWKTLLNIPDQDAYQIVSNQLNNGIRTYLTRENQSIPMQLKPYPLTYEGYEGFHILDKIPVSDITGARFTAVDVHPTSDMVCIMSVLAGALYKLPYKGHEIRIASSLLEDNMVNTESFMSQAYFHISSLYTEADDENEEKAISCLEAINRICGTFGLIPIYYNGNWVFIKVSEINHTDLVVYRYTNAGVFIASTTINNVITLTGNAVTPANRKDWINFNAVETTLPAYRDIIVETLRSKFPSFWEYSYFKNWTTSTNKQIPSGWGLTDQTYPQYNGIGKVTEEKYFVDGIAYYPMKLPGMYNANVIYDDTTAVV